MKISQFEKLFLQNFSYIKPKEVNRFKYVYLNYVLLITKDDVQLMRWLIKTKQTEDN